MRGVLVAALLAISAAVGAAASACAPQPPAAVDDCDKARAIFEKCGVSLPILSQGPCTGAQHAVARCVANHASTCDELSTLVGRIDACVADELDGGDLPPAEDLPVPSFPDAARDAAPDANDDADATVVPTFFDASWGGADAGEAGVTAAGSIRAGEEQLVDAPALSAGAHSFSVGGVGSCDLFVRASAPPTTEDFDCRTNLTGGAACTLTLDSPQTVHLMVRGVAAVSDFSLTVR